MNNIPSALELMLAESWNDEMTSSDPVISADRAANIANDLIKQHVQAALEAAAKNASHKGCKCQRSSCTYSECWDIDQSSILTAYPPENIK
jgi:hypothetical protein